MKRLEFFGLSVVLCICMAVVEVRVGALTPRILGGRSAREGQFPYQAEVTIQEVHHCGASLISQNYVLTAAHCVVFWHSTKKVPISYVKVRAGTIDLNSGGVLVEVSDINVHPDYRNDEGFGAPNSDIALLKLATPLEFTDKIKAIELAEVAVQPGTTITVSGWGHLSLQGSYSAKLQHLNLKVVTDEECRASYSWFRHTTFCATQMDKSTCVGDSGGPAVYNGSLVGILSFGHKNYTSDGPSGLTKISMFREWIIENSDLKVN